MRSTVGRTLLVVIVLAVACLLFLNTWQGYRYERLENEVTELERKQREWLDRNKTAVIGIAILRSPSRIGHVAQEHLALNRGVDVPLTIVRIVR